MIEEKICLKCKIPKSLEQFSRWKHSTDGRQTWCKQCVKEYGTVEKHRERVRENKRTRRQNPEVRQKESNDRKRYKKENPQRFLWRAAKDRSLKFGIPFNIEIEDIVIPKLCPVLKVPMEPYTRYAPSLDKKIPILGYVKGNIQVISLLANKMKADANSEELKAFAEYFFTLNL